MALVNASLEGVIVADSRGIILSANPQAHLMFGYEDAELLGLELRRLIPEDMRPAHDIGFARAVDTGTLRGKRIIEANALKKDGHTFPCEVSLGQWREGHDPAFGAVIRDLTERKQRDREIATLGSAVDQTADAVVITCLTGEIEYVNTAFERMTGFSASEVIGQNPRILKSGRVVGTPSAAMASLTMYSRITGPSADLPSPPRENDVRPEPFNCRS